MNSLSHLSHNFKIEKCSQYIFSIEGLDDINIDEKLIDSKFHELYTNITQNQNSESSELTKARIRIIIDISNSF